MVKIYFEKTEIYLASTAEIENMPTFLQRKEDLLYFNDPKTKEINTLIKLIDDNPKSLHQLCLTSNNLAQLISDFKKAFKIVAAAGGFVLNNNNELLLIYRRGKWDLPKGKIEENESIKNAAVREVEEETGVKITQLKEQLNSLETAQNCTYHIYVSKKGNYILKPTYWFVMNTNENNPLIPQFEEDIVEAKWVSLKNLESYLNNTYQTITDVIASGVKTLE